MAAVMVVPTAQLLQKKWILLL